jgi:hypothetical protein
MSHSDIYNNNNTGECPIFDVLRKILSDSHLPIKFSVGFSLPCPEPAKSHGSHWAGSFGVASDDPPAEGGDNLSVNRRWLAHL